MRVLHITRDFPPKNNGGLSTAVGGLVRAQERAGLECVVVSFDDFRHTPDRESIKREPARSITTNGTVVLHVTGKAAMRRTAELAENFVADIVHVHHESLWKFSSEIAHYNRSPTVLSVHVLQSEQNRLRGIRSTTSSEAQHLALREATKIHAPSKAVADLLLDSTMAIAGRLQIVPLALEPWAAAAAAAAAAAQQQEDRSRGDPTLLYVGRFSDINGFAQLLEALPSLFSKRPTLRATIAGGLPENPRSEKRWHKRWKKMSGEYESRLCWAGWLGRDALSRHYAQATMLVVPSWFETFGQVAWEGIMHGIPLITTGAGALAEIADRETALIIENQSAEAITTAVQEILTSPDAARERSVEARRRLEPKSHWPQRATEFISLYRSALSN